MPTSDRIARLLVVGLGLGLGTAAALDGTPAVAPALAPALERSNETASSPAIISPRASAPTIVRAPTDGIPRPPRAIPNAVPVAKLPPRQTPFEAFRSGTQALRAGETEKGVTLMQYAAEQGHAPAQWKLGRMYAEGDGVPRSELRAFEYFSRMADAHAEDSPQSPQARFVANAFVELGHYYRDGIANSAVKPDQQRAREMFSYAASYFADPDAQYNLARLYLSGSPRDPRSAVRWLDLAVRKGHPGAQALLGRILFKGEYGQRQPARGLMLLMIARDNAGPQDSWIVEQHDAAFKQASDDERALALAYLERWLKGRRD